MESSVYTIDCVRASDCGKFVTVIFKRGRDSEVSCFGLGVTKEEVLRELADLNIRSGRAVEAAQRLAEELL